MKIALVIQFNDIIGPLLKIVEKMGNEFIYFLIFYLILTLMFVVIFNLLFMYYSKEYSTLFNALVTIVNAGVGNFGYVSFDTIPDIRLAIFGKLFLVVLIVVFLILMLNLIIAILTNVSNTYENLSTGLFLSKILSTRE